MKETKFKQTEIGEIPVDWEVKELGTLCKSISSGKNKSRLDNGNYPVYGSTGIISYTNFYQYSGSSILIARVGANAGLINKATGKYDVSDNTLVLENIESNINLLVSLLKMANLNKLVFGSGQPLITGSQLKKVKLPLPPTLAEQQRIAKALGDVDNAIATSEKLIQKKKNVKQGAMQLLLTGKKRLPGFAKSTGYKHTELGDIPEDWEVKKIRKIAMVKRGVRVVRRNLQENGCYPVFQNSLKPLGFFDKYNCQENSTFIICGGAAGEIGFSSIKFWAADDCFVIETNMENKFIYYNLLLKKIYIEKNVRRASIPRLSHDVIDNMLIPLPSKPEQSAIAKVLSDMDKEIDGLNKKLQKYRQLKTAMMQQLLTGKIRLV